MDDNSRSAPSKGPVTQNAMPQALLTGSVPLFLSLFLSLLLLPGGLASPSTAAAQVKKRAAPRKASASEKKATPSTATAQVKKEAKGSPPAPSSQKTPTATRRPRPPNKKPAAPPPPQGTKTEKAPTQLKGVTIKEKLGQKIDGDHFFFDHNDKRVKLLDFFLGTKPVLLTLNYTRCKMLCDLQLNGLVEGLRGLKWRAGKQFRIVTLSIDHRETQQSLRYARQGYLKKLGQGPVDWTFLRGTPQDIRAVANSVGFRFRYDPKTDQFAHVAAIFFIAPGGKISKYLYGVSYPPQNLKFALMEASQGKVGSTLDRILLSCFHYDSNQGKYTVAAYGVMRLGGALTLLVLVVILALYWRRESKRKAESDS